MSELAKRVAFAAAAIPVVLAVIWMGGFALAVLLGGVAAVAAWELFRMAGATGTSALRGHGLILAAALPLGVYARAEGFWTPPISIAILVVLELLAVALWTRGARGRPLEAVGVTLLGALYTGGMLAPAYALRHHPYAVDAIAGTLLVLLPLVVTWATDTGAMFIGRAWGTTRLMPSISPGKTIVGCWAGALIATIAAVAYVALVLRPFARLSMPLATAAAFGFVVSAVGQVGDLVESMMKRAADVKDSSALIPGHGGALDRVDSLLFTLPVSFVLLDLLLAAAP